mgnify:CR=1 FL=1
MITDKLLAFADGKALTTTANSDTIDLGKAGDEIARTLNLVAQLDDCGSVTPTSASITPSLQMSKDGGTTWNTVLTFPAKTVANCIAGQRLINFAKLPLGGLGGQMRLVMTVADGPLVGAKYSAWLTESVEA